VQSLVTVRSADPGDSGTAPTRFILVVDDDAVTRQLCSGLLERAGYECTAAASGEEAISIIETRTPDLIILDLSMPGMDGWSVAAMIRKHKPTAHVPILVMTALGQNLEDSARRVGATAFVLKPIDSKRFLKEVKRLCPGA
jgi:CheY-like chemotaxis protein